ncbi:MAG: DNA polymerase III subunit gamma/tau [Chthoniobacteraceae bacterium]
MARFFCGAVRGGVDAKNRSRAFPLDTLHDALNTSPVSYTVFARKYRPQTFDEVVGQDHITQTLKNAIEQDRLAHAYIFVGPRGTGKTSTARILAKALNCVKGPTVTPCGECISCREIAAGNSMDVLEFDAASNTQVDKIREIIIDNVKYTPAHGRYKLYIVDEVHMLSASSFNALLKTLEEPPAHVKFVFATTDPQKVPTTILSRCQRFDLKRIPTPLMRDHLLMIAEKEGVALETDAAEAIARGAEGGMRDAESMLDQLVAFCGQTIAEPDVLRVFGFTSQQTVAELCDHLLHHDAPAALRLVHQESEDGRDLLRLLGDLISHLRNLLIAKADAGALDDELSAEAIGIATAQAERIEMARLLELIEQFASAEGRMKWAPNKKLYLEVAILRAIQTLSQATLTEVIDTLAAMRGGTPPPASATKRSEPVKKSAASHPERSAVLGAQSKDPAPRPSASSRKEHLPTRADPPGSSRKSTPAPETSTVAEPEPEPTPVPTLDLTELWHQVIRRTRAERPLIASCVEAGALLEMSGDTAMVGFPLDQTLAVDLLDSPNNRHFVEQLLHEFSQRNVAVRCVTREGLTVTPLAREPAPAPPAEVDPMEAFKDDPLIRKALELFKAQIQPVG